MMLSEDDFILKLGDAEERGIDGGPVDSTLAGMLSELETLVKEVRQPPTPDPYLDEPELALALSRAEVISQSPPTEALDGSPGEVPSPSTRPKTFLGQYELLAQIGAGGMGTVYKALHTRLGRIVALKVLPAGRLQSKQAIARFDREMRAAGKLHHPNIVAAQDAGEADGTHFLVMELVHGCDLSTLIKAAGPLSIPDACEIARQAALGLQHLADHGLVHRDIKPSNLMLARSPVAAEQPTVKILDLGLAQFATGELEPAHDITATGQVIGTVDYMAPEQGLEGSSRIDIRADLYSLGATLFKLLTGRAPFEDPKYNTTMKRLQALERETPLTLTELLPDCPPALSDLVARLLSKSPADRPAKPEDVAKELASFARGANLSAQLKFVPEFDAGTAGPMSLTFTPASTAPLSPEPSSAIPAHTNTASDIGAAEQRPSRSRWPTMCGGFAALALLLAVIVVQTDRGTITIEAPEELLEQVSVSFLRNGAPTGADFVIKPGMNEHHIRSGRVQVRLPAAMEDQFELQPKGDLIVRRGDRLPLKLTLRQREEEVVTSPQPQAPADVTMPEDSGSENFALEFNGKDDYVELPDLEFDFAQPFTIEAWFTPHKDKPAEVTVENNYDPIFGSSQTVLDPPSWCALIYNRYAELPGVWGGLSVKGEHDLRQVWLFREFKGERHCTAMTWDGKTLRGYVDGHLDQSGERKLPAPPAPKITNRVIPAMVGRAFWMEKNDFRYFSGAIDELRISKGVKYQDNYEPAGRLTADADTVALYHFDQGQGELLKDSSGHARHGKIVGAKWVRRKSDAKPETQPPGHIATPLTIDEPPPLDEWLKGRTILTVAQDGSGQFNTIQAALDALQEGQAVKVLDHGPYHERLHVRSLPDNTGLFSELATVIEVPQWKYGWNEQIPNKPEANEVYVGHWLSGCNGFRIHGFDFRVPSANGNSWVRPLLASRIKEIVLENCCFRAATGAEWTTVELSDLDLSVKDGIGMTAMVRNCVFESCLTAAVHHAKHPPERERLSTVTVQQNYFVGSDVDRQIQAVGKSFEKIIIRYNVFAGKAKKDMIFTAMTGEGAVEVSNNTLSSELGIVFNQAVPTGSIVLRNNLRSQPGFIELRGVAETESPQVSRDWNIDHNAYPEASGGSTPGLLMPRAPGDLEIMPRFLSKVPAELDYYRISAADPLANAGAGGEWPIYLGALPPGPAPQNGDWFTRLRERWGDLKPSEPQEMSGPIQIDEPPSLDEWLKGRTILTVTQDGSGQFTTIQAALNALQPGQVVKVLDEGPYRESLRCTLPYDTGLISNANTVLSADEWPADQHAHQFKLVERFRLQGLRIQAQGRDGFFEVLQMMNPGGLVIEDCTIGLSNPDLASRCSGLELSYDRDSQHSAPVRIRNCLFDKYVGISGPIDQDGMLTSKIILERNFFRSTGIVAYKVELTSLIIRHNVFDAAPLPILCSGVAGVRHRLAILNNTLIPPRDGKSSVMFAGKAPPANVVFQNNLTASNAIDLRVDDTEFDASRLAWQLDHNGYIQESSQPLKSVEDIIGPYSFLAIDPVSLDAWRIASDSPLATGGAGGDLARYIGALPPGPAPKDGDWFTRLRERWGDLKPSEPKEMSGPIQIDEPPPLDEWLKGRTILTVALDGSGQFKTIQAAFNALQPGQAIQVLDKGPYQERLEVELLPKDTGLFSVVNTVLALPEWKLVDEVDGNNQPKTIYRGHILKHADGFRLHGFECRFPQTTYEVGQRFTSHFARDLTLENCCFRADEKIYGEAIDLGNWGDKGSSEIRVTVRDCVIEGSLAIGAFEGYGTAIVERNHFLYKGNRWRVMLWGQNLKQLRLKDNVFSAYNVIPDEADVLMANFNRADTLEISNNSFGARHALSFNALPEGTVRILNNLHYQPGIFMFAGDGPEQIRLEVADRWQVDHNAYQILPEAKSHPGIVPTPAGDFDVIPRVLSKIPQDRNYLRIDPNDPLANSGVGGEWPSYLGALPPGPAPKEGDWFTRLRERWGEIKPDKPAEPKDKISGPIEIQGPPPLDEWLKDRTILTVAQDGSGQFNTIQAALDAMQAGQAVHVLDKGPYRERLEVAALPKDTGLFSTADTVLESSDWKYLYDFHYENVGMISAYAGHILSQAQGFRVHGFEFRFPPHQHKVAHRLSVTNARDFTLENCCIRAQNNFDGDHVDIASSRDNLSPGMRVTVRDCAIEGSFAISSPTGAATVLVERNDFSSKKNQHYLMLAGAKWDKVRLHHNIFNSAIETRDDIVFAGISNFGTLEISNNSFGSHDTLVFAKTLPDGAITIRNNLHFKPGAFMTTTYGAEQRQSFIAEHWNVDHNASQELPENKNSSNVVPQLRGDFATIPRLLSKIPQSADYLRIEKDDPLADAGAGGDWPTYLGALLPGPAPKDGDWFTRLRERWGDLKAETPVQSKVEASGPIEIQEPPLLNEWLKGRTILTVAQDGSGQFQTIQAALDAVQAGQVVKVLDRGPYRERLELQSPPADIGLISEVQTRIEFTEFKPVVDSLVQGRGHFFVKANRLRIHGLEFQIPQIPANQSMIGMEVSGSRAVVFENCAVRRKESPASSSLTMGFIRGSVEEPTVIRDCFLEQGVQVYSLPPLLDSDPPAGSVLVTRNYVTGEEFGLMAGDIFQQCVIRNNIFAGTLRFPMIQNVVQADWFELSNNTFITIPTAVVIDSLGAWTLHERSLNDRKGKKTPPPAPDRGHAPSGQGAIYNNLHNRPGFMNVTGGAEEEPWTWQVGYNCYPGDGEIPAKNALPRDTNLIAKPIFYSILPHDQNYARLKPDSPGATSPAGGKWPNYTGALPPGPAPEDGDWFTRLWERWSKP